MSAKHALRAVCLKEFPGSVFISDMELCELLTLRRFRQNNPESSAATVTELRKRYASGVAYTWGGTFGFRFGLKGEQYVSF